MKNKCNISPIRSKINVFLALFEVIGQQPLNSYLFSKFYFMRKVEIGKRFFFRVRHKKSWAEGETFFLSNPVKNIFVIETFPYKSKILRMRYFFSWDCIFLKAGGLENSCLLHKSGNLLITGPFGHWVFKKSGWMGKVWSRHEK